MHLDWVSERPVPLDHGGPSNRPFDAIDEAWLARDMVARFEHICARFPDRIAVDDGEIALTYAELRTRAWALAGELAGQGGPTQPIAAIIPGTALYPIALLACLAAGRPLTPVDVTHPLPRRAAILAEAQPKLALVAEGQGLEPGLLADDVPRLVISARSPLPTAPLTPPGAVDPEALAGIAFTSGSTGRAKGLAYRQRDIFLVVAEHVNSLHINEEDVILSLASLGAGGNLDVLSALLTGGKVRMLDIKSAGMGETLRVLGDDRITLLSMIPLVFRTLFQQASARKAFSTVRAINTGGDRLMGSDIALFREVLPEGCHIRTTQGSTETGVVFNWFVPPEAEFPDLATVPSGYLATGKEVALVGSEPGPEGTVEGEFLVRGSSLAAGSWQDGRLTPGPFVSDPEHAGRKIFDTGDIVRRRPDGLFEFVGRRDRQIKILGLRADPAEVELILRKAPGVADVAVIPRRTGDQVALIAYVAPLDLHAPPEPSALREAVQAEAPRHMVPAEVRLLPAIPRLPNFKADFLALEALDRHNRAVVAPEAPPASAVSDSRIAQAVRTAWSVVLEPAAYSQQRSFDEAGGDSLKALQVVLTLEQQLAATLPLDLIDASVTPQMLIDRVAAALADEARPDDGRPQVFLCPGVGGDEPRLADLRRLLAPDLAFVVIRYPGIERPVEEISSLELIVTEALRQIEAAAPDGPVRLCGYSAGGALAHELAVRLAAKGRVVEQLAIIDARPQITGERRGAGRGDFASEIGRLQARLVRTGWRQTLQDRLVALLIRLQALELLRRLVILRSRDGAHHGAFTRQMLLINAHGRAFVGWRATPYAGPVSIFVAEDQEGADLPLDLGWKAYSPQAEIHPLPGTHWALLNPPTNRQLADGLRRVLAAPGPTSRH